MTSQAQQLSTMLLASPPIKAILSSSAAGSLAYSQTSSLTSAVSLQTHNVLPSPPDLRRGSTSSAVVSDTRLADESNTPRALLEGKAYDSLVQAKVWTSFVAKHLPDTNRKRLFAQLDELHQIDDWEEGDGPLITRSFQSFLRTMLILKPGRWPTLGMSHTGNLIAIWGTSRDRVVLEFLAGDQVKWSLSHNRPDGTTVRNAGIGPAAEIETLLAPYHPAHWFENAEKNNR